MTYKLLEVKARRKQLCALLLSPMPDIKELGGEADSTGALVLDSEICEIHKLSSLRQIEESDLIKYIHESHFKRAKSRAMWYISRSDCSKKEIFDKLRRSFPETESKMAVDRMEELGLLCDDQYAKRKARSLVEFKKMSKKQAKFELIQKGIDRETAELALEAVEKDNADTILSLLQGKHKNKLSNEKDVSRTIAALLRKGFSYGEIKEALGKVISEIPEVYED